MTLATGTHMAGSLTVQRTGENGTLTFVLTGRLDMESTGRVWREAQRVLQDRPPASIVVDASGVSYCDGAGIAWLVKLQQHQAGVGAELIISGLHEQFRRLLDIYGELGTEPRTGRPRRLSFVEQVGLNSVRLGEDIRALLAFVGELTVILVQAARHPRRIRWRDAWLIAEQTGVNAVPIITLIGILMGLILAFQAAMPMRRFGADIFVADLLGLGMLREMGPLMTAIILAGRSGSAFAAELGTMKIREEIDALSTMGIEPVRFLVLPRVLAAVTMTPLLTVFANLFGLLGGAVVMRSLGFPLVTYVNQILSAVTAGDLAGGLLKSLVYGLVVSAIGCLRGLQTTTGAGAVGRSTTSAVVSGIVLIALVDGVFAAVFYAVGL